MGHEEFKYACGFCKKEMTEEETKSEGVGFIKFPDGETKPCHLSHVGAADEWEKQHKK